MNKIEEIKKLKQLIKLMERVMPTPNFEIHSQIRDLKRSLSE